MSRYTGTGFSAATHPLLQQKLRSQFPSSCNIQTPNTTTEASGQKVLTGTGTNVTGMIGIPCRIAAFSEQTLPGDKEKRGPTIETDTMRICYLSDYYPAAKPRTHIALVDSVVYQIRGVEHDSERCYTRLSLEILKPGVLNG